MKILTRTKTEKTWKLVESAAYEGEKELQQLLAESPSLISIPDVREGTSQLVVAIREFPLPLIGYIDLLAFSADGDMTLIECKLASNPQIKREVVGQALEYGGQLWQMRYEDLDEKIKIRSGKSLAELMREALGETEWDEEAFRENVESALVAGSFILMIVVDQVTDELSRIIHFVNNCGRPAFTFAALEMRRFQSDQTEMLVPRVIGDHTGPSPANVAGRKQWTEGMFFEDASRRCEPAVVSTMQKLFDWAKSMGKVRFGTGTVSGSYTLYQERNSKSSSVFSIYSDGTLTIHLGNMAKIFSEEEIDNFRKSLSMIPTLGEIETCTTYFYNKKMGDVFSKPEYLTQFMNCVRGLR